MLRQHQGDLESARRMSRPPLMQEEAQTLTSEHFLADLNLSRKVPA